MTELTDRQYEVLRFIGDQIIGSKPAPTLREIGAAIGIVSTNGVNDHLRALERKGFIVRTDMKSRHIRLTPRAYAKLGASVPQLTFRTSLLERLHAECARWQKAGSPMAVGMALAAIREVLAEIERYDAGGPS